MASRQPESDDAPEQAAPPASGAGPSTSPAAADTSAGGGSPKLAPPDQGSEPAISEGGDEPGNEKQAEAEAAADVVLFTDCIGRKFRVPMFAARTWEGMDNLIRGEFLDMEHLFRFVDEGRYDLCLMDGFPIEKSLWSKVIKPGMEVKMELQRQPETQEDDSFVVEEDGRGTRIRIPGVGTGLEPPGSITEEDSRPACIDQPPGAPPPSGTPPPEEPSQGPAKDDGSDIVVINVSRSPSPAGYRDYRSGRDFDRQYPFRPPPSPPADFYRSGSGYPSGPPPPPIPNDRKPYRRDLYTRNLYRDDSGIRRKPRSATGSESPSLPYMDQGTASPKIMNSRNYNQAGPRVRVRPPHTREYTRTRVRESLDSYATVASPTATETPSEDDRLRSYNRAGHRRLRSRAAGAAAYSRYVSAPLMISEEDPRQVPSRPTVTDAYERGWIFSVKLKPDATKGPALGQAQVSFPMGVPKQPEKSRDIIIHSARRHDMDDDRDRPDGNQVYLHYSDVATATPALPTEPSIKKPATCRWTHVYRRMMNFEDFELSCRNVFTRPGEPLTAVMELLQKVGASWGLREGKLVDPGTVVRCDGELKGETKESAVFVSVPYLGTDKLTLKWEKIHKQFPSHPSRQLYHAVRRFEGRVGRDAGQTFLKKDGNKKNVLWVHDLWVISAGNTFLTYGNVSFEDLCGDSIVPKRIDALPSSGAVRAIDFIDSEGTILNIDITNAKSFYEFKALIQERINVSDHLNLVDQDDIPFTPEIWNAVRRSRDPLAIRLHARQPDRLTSDSDSNSGLDLDGSEDSDDSADSDSQMQTQGALPHTHTPDVGTEYPNLQPHAGVPPFMFWQVADANAEAAAGSVVQALGVLDIIETKFTNPDGTTRSRLLVDDESWIQGVPLGDDGIYAGTPDANLPELEAMMLECILKDAEAPPMVDLLSAENFRSRLGQLTRDVYVFTKFFQEVFAPIGLEHPVTRKLFGALVAIVKVTTQQKADDSSLAASRISLERQWIIRHIPPETRSVPVLSPAELPNGCDDCNEFTIYSSRSDALDHLRRVHVPRHLLGSPSYPSTRALREFLLPTKDVGQMTILKLGFFGRILRKSRDRLERLCTITRGIQGALLSEGGEFTPPPNGFPSGLLLAYQQFVLLICWTQYLVQYTDHFFAPARFSHLSSISLGRLVRTTDALMDLANDVERYLHSGQSQIIRGFRTGGASSSVFKEVGPVYLVGEIVNNLLSRKIAAGSDVVDLYQAYVDELEDKGLADPSKRHRPPLTNLSNEIGKLKVVTQWQQDILKVYRLVTDPRTEQIPSDRRKRESPLDKALIDASMRMLRDRKARFTDMQATCRETVDKILEVMEIEKDDQDRAILVFTLVTIIFLPLSFLTSYFSMNTEISSGGWDGIQRQFWSISVAMTIILGLLCGVMAYWETMTAWLRNHRPFGRERPQAQEVANWREEVALWREKGRQDNRRLSGLRRRRRMSPSGAHYV